MNKVIDLVVGYARLMAAPMLILCCAGCDADYDQVPLEQFQNVRHLSTGLPLPPSASNVWNNEHKFQDATQRLRFDASIADARRFARAILRREPVAGEPELYNMWANGELDWWIDAYPPAGVGGRLNDYPNGSTFLVLQPMGDRARVWIATWDNCDRPQSCISWAAH